MRGDSNLLVAVARARRMRATRGGAGRGSAAGGRFYNVRGRHRESSSRPPGQGNGGEVPLWWAPPPPFWTNPDVPPPYIPLPRMGPRASVAAAGLRSPVGSGRSPQLQNAPPYYQPP